MSVMFPEIAEVFLHTGLVDPKAQDSFKECVRMCDAFLDAAAGKLADLLMQHVEDDGTTDVLLLDSRDTLAVCHASDEICTNAESLARDHNFIRQIRPFHSLPIAAEDMSLPSLITYGKRFVSDIDIIAHIASQLE